MVFLSEGVTSISSFAFKNCGRLTSITISVSVTSIGDFAFSGCKSLKSLYFKGTSKQWESIKKGFNWDQDVSSYSVYYV